MSNQYVVNQIKQILQQMQQSEARNAQLLQQLQQAEQQAVQQTRQLQQLVSQIDTNLPVGQTMQSGYGYQTVPQFSEGTRSFFGNYSQPKDFSQQGFSYSGTQF